MTYTLFYGHDPKYQYSCFSQWYSALMLTDDKAYLTCEHYMMAAKARLFEDTESEKKILAANHPNEAKKLGRKVKNFDNAIWNANREQIVFDGNLLKFSQYAALKNLLLSTDDSILVEASPSDTIWGIGLPINHPDCYDESKWRGTNLLGIALMKVRQTLVEI